MKISTRGIIKDAVIVIVGAVLIWVGLQAVFGTPNPFYVVSSGSMIPELQVYDVLVVNGNEPFGEIGVGDIIVFNRPSDHDRVIVHRVAAVIDDDPRTLRAKGDANPSSIPGTDFPITSEEYIGQVAYVVPQIGYVTRVLTPPVNYIIIAIIIGIMVAQQYSKKVKQDKAAKSVPDGGPRKAPDTGRADAESRGTWSGDKDRAHAGERGGQSKNDPNSGGTHDSKGDGGTKPEDVDGAKSGGAHDSKDDGRIEPEGDKDKTIHDGQPKNGNSPPDEKT